MSWSFEDWLKEKCVFGLRLYALIGIIVGALIVLLLFSLAFWMSFRKRARMIKLPISNSQSSHKLSSTTLQATALKPIPQALIELPMNSSGNISEDRLTIEKEIVHIRQGSAETPSSAEMHKTVLATSKATPDTAKTTIESRFESSSNGTNTMEGLERTSSFGCASSSPSEVLVSHLGWGHWYSLKDLEVATSYFVESNVVGKGGYGIVYHGILADGTHIAVKKLVNNRGQAEREFKVEVEAIGRVRHKNLVRLHGYCMEGAHRMLVYEYIDNGNLDQWLHGPLGEKNPMSWDTRMKILVGTAKGLAYLHEGLEPKVVHRDVKPSNILIDSQWNPKISDFGLAKLLGAENSHVTTRVMGTFGYVAPEYASTGLLNEKSDVYSYGVLLMELITGRDPVDYNRPSGEVNLVDWLKMMVGSRRSDEVADPKMEVKPSLRSLKRALLVSLRCVDPDALKRPKMSHVIHMLETDDNPFREERKSSRDVVPRTKSNPNQLQTILQNQGTSLDSQNQTSSKKEAFFRRLVSEDASLQKEVPVESDPEIDNGSTYDPKAKWRRFED